MVSRRDHAGFFLLFAIASRAMPEFLGPWIKASCWYGRILSRAHSRADGWVMGKPFKLQNGQLLLSTEAPGGVYSAVQLKKIAELCDGDSAMAKATEDQRLALFVAPEKAAHVASALRSTGLGVRHYQDGLHQPINCIGELCPEHLQDAMGAGIDIAAELAAVKLESPLKIGINGCARGCVASHTLDISILGESGGYRISIGGKNSQIPEMAAYMADGVPSAKLPKLIAKIVSIYKEIAEPGESLQEVIERHGASKFIAALAPYSQDANVDDSSEGNPALGVGDDHEELKLDDLGVTSQMRHDGPEIDMNLSDVELASEPTVDGLLPEPVLQDYAEEVVDEEVVDDQIVAEQIVAEEALESDLEVRAEVDTAFEGEMPLEVLQPIEEFAEETLPADLLDEPSAADHPVNAELAAAEELIVDEVTKAESVDQTMATDFGMSEHDVVGEVHVLEVHAEEAHAEEAHAEEAHAEEVHAQDAHAVEAHAVEAHAEEAHAEDVKIIDLPLDEVFSEELITEEHMEEERAEHAEHAPEMFTDEPVTIGSIDAELAHDAMIAEELPFSAEAIEAVLPDEGAGHAELVSVDEVGEVPMPDESKLPKDAVLPMVALQPTIQLLPAAISSADEFAADELNEADADTFEQNINAQIAEDKNLPEIEDINSSERDETMQLLAAQVESTEPDTFEEKHMATSNFAPRSGSVGEGSAQSGASGFEFIGLDLTGDGRISLQFASGAAMAIDPWALVGNSRRELRLAGKVIVLTPVDQGINVEVDGVSIFLPQKAAA